MNKIRTILGVFMVSVIIGALALTGYNQYYWKYIAPTQTTVSTTYVDSLTYAENETYFIETNYFSNDLKNGEEVFETRLNFYTDPAIVPPGQEVFKNIHSDGIQFVGQPEFEKKWTTRKSCHGIAFPGIKSVRLLPAGNHFFYNTTNGISYGAVEELGIDSNAWIVDFDGTIGLVKQKGYTTSSEAFLRKTQPSVWPISEYEEFDVMTFVDRLYKAVKTLPNGIHALQFNLSKWFTGFVLDESGRKFETTAHAHQNWLYVNVKVKRSPNGLISADQSIFKQVRKQGDYVFKGQGTNDYWNSNTIYNLTVNDFDFVPYNGSTTDYLARLKPAAINYLSSFNNLDVNVVIDLDSKYLADINKKLVGFATNPYGILNVKQTTITSKAPATFKVHEQLKNTQLTNVTIELIGGGI